MKIGLCGSHGVGKTSLIDEFVKLHPDHVSIIEGIRNVVVKYDIQKEYNKGNETLQFIYAYNHIIQIQKLTDFVSDRTLIDNYAYYLSFDFKKKFKSIYEDLVLSNLDNYDVICYIPIEFECENDNFRFGKSFQKIIDDCILEIINNFNIDVVTISGSFENRLNQLEKLL